MFRFWCFAEYYKTYTEAYPFWTRPLLDFLLNRLQPFLPSFNNRRVLKWIFVFFLTHRFTYKFVRSLKKRKKSTFIVELCLKSLIDASFITGSRCEMLDGFTVPKNDERRETPTVFPFLCSHICTAGAGIKIVFYFLFFFLVIRENDDAGTVTFQGRRKEHRC